MTDKTAVAGPVDPPVGPLCQKRETDERHNATHANTQVPTADAGRLETPVRPRAWMRRWYFDGDEPKKERNEKGRMAYPVKFKFLAVTPNQIFADDVPLYTWPESAQRQLKRRP